MISVQLFLSGMDNSPYLPAGIFVPPMVTSSAKVNVVAWFAPVLQTLPKGTKSPNNLRPFTLGREYYNSILESPKFCLMFLVGLGWGVLNCANVIKFMQEQNVTTKRILFIFFSLL